MFMKFSLQLVWLPPLSLEAKTIRVAATRNEESKQRQELLKEATFGRAGEMVNCDILTLNIKLSLQYDCLSQSMTF